jgi:hypothetical protein
MALQRPCMLAYRPSRRRVHAPQGGALCKHRPRPLRSPWQQGGVHALLAARACAAGSAVWLRTQSTGASCSRWGLLSTSLLLSSPFGGCSSETLSYSRGYISALPEHNFDR